MSTTLELPAVGTIMPDITFTNEKGAAVTLRDLAAGRQALVYFMRAATCPICNVHVQAISRMVADGELANVAVVIVTQEMRRMRRPSPASYLPEPQPSSPPRRRAARPSDSAAS